MQSEFTRRSNFKDDMQTAWMPKEEKYGGLDYARADCTCEIMKRIMRGFSTSDFRWFADQHEARSLGGLSLQPFSQWLHSAAGQEHMVLSRWFTMTGPTEASIVYLTSDFSWERSVKKFTAVPQLGPGPYKNAAQFRVSANSSSNRCNPATATIGAFGVSRLDRTPRINNNSANMLMLFFSLPPSPPEKWN